jgi:hypothetical protein
MLSRVSLVIVLLYTAVVDCRRTFAPSILPKPAVQPTSTTHTPTQLLRSAMPSLALRGGGPTQEDTGVSFDSHLNVDKIPATLLNKLDGSHTMRAKFEKLVRHAQVSGRANHFFLISCCGLV